MLIAAFSEIHSGRRRNAHVIWATIIAMLSATIVSFMLTGLCVDPVSNLAVLALLVSLIGLAWFYRSIRPDLRVSHAVESAAQLLIVSLLGILLSYAAIAANFPYRDAELYALDQWLGLDRRAYLQFFNSRPWLADICGAAYMSIQPQTALIPLVLVIADQIGRLQQFIVALSIALSITVAISVFFPALAAFVYLDLTPETYAHISSTVYTHVPTLEALRSGALKFIKLNELEGLLTFPSFHTAAAILFAWALWGVRYARVPAILANAAMLIATPLDGAHYFVDLLGGAGVALLALGVSARLVVHDKDAAAFNISVVSPLPPAIAPSGHAI